MLYSFQGSPSFILVCKLKALKIDLKNWNDEVVGNLEKHKKFVLDELQGLDVVAAERTLSDFEDLRNTKIISDLRGLPQ
jgi:hypothetical protein